MRAFTTEQLIAKGRTGEQEGPAGVSDWNLTDSSYDPVSHDSSIKRKVFETGYALINLTPQEVNQFKVSMGSRKK